jgi:hypothetical protein
VVIGRCQLLVLNEIGNFGIIVGVVVFVRVEESRRKFDC